MQDHRIAGELPESPANPSPPIATVHGLGESHALRADLLPVQVPWLADEVRALRACVNEELAIARAQHDPAKAAAGSRSDLDAESDRRLYQLRMLRMIREQVPLADPVVAACVEDPWQPDDAALEVARLTAPVTVVGPARAMLVLVRGAARNVADAFGEALRGPKPVGKSDATAGGDLTRWPELHSLTPAVAARLRDLAAAASAFTDTYVAAVAQQGYVFDPEHYPVYPDVLW
jgi:hypothetical protein